MEYRFIDKLGVKLSLLGFGCMRLPKLDNGEIDEREAERLLDCAILQGVNYLDTAYFYHNGKSEAFVGRVIQKYPRDILHIATKLPMSKVRSLEQAKTIFNDQLERLKVDYFDFYLLHALDKARWDCAVQTGIVDYLEDLQAQGKIRFFGFSFHDQYDVFEEILRYREWDFCQMQLNYLDTEHQQGLRGYQLAEELDVPVVVMEPVKGGALAQLPKEIADEFISVNPQRSLASWALRWVGSLPQVKVILSGMSSYEQVEDNLAVFSPFVSLNEEEVALVSRVANAIKSKVKNGCTGCEYCMPCPFGVNIPECFKAWNELAMFQNSAKAKQMYYNMMAESERAFACRGCGSCEKKCPQKIKIRQDLFRVAVDLAPNKV